MQKSIFYGIYISKIISKSGCFSLGKCFRNCCCDVVGISVQGGKGWYDYVTSVLSQIMKQSAEHPFLISHNSPILQEERVIKGSLADGCPEMEYIYEICTQCLHLVLFWIERCIWSIYLYSSRLFTDVDVIKSCFLSPILKLKSLEKLSQSDLALFSLPFLVTLKPSYCVKCQVPRLTT